LLRGSESDFFLQGGLVVRFRPVPESAEPLLQGEDVVFDVSESFEVCPGRFWD